MTAHLAALSANPALRETAALYIVHVATYFLPLAVIPYAARVLGPEAWGLLAFFQSLALYGSMLIEYGFGLSGTRELARHRGDAPARARILAGVTAAKLLLAAACALLLSGFCLASPLAHAHPGLAAAAVFFALGQGASCVWYLQGVGQTGRIAKAELLFRSFAVILIFALLRRPEQAWLLLAVNGAAAWASALYALRVIARDTAILRPTLAAAIETLRLGLSLFFFRSAVSLYTLANAFLLGLFVSPLLVGYYAGAERIAKGFLGLMQPLGQSLYAQLNQRLHLPGAAPSRLLAWNLALLGGSGALCGAVIWLAAPWLVSLILGPGFEPTVPVLRILAALPPLVGLGTALGMNWMLPRGMDRQFNLVIAGAGLLNVALACWLAPTLAHTGMAIAVAASEAFVAAACFLCLRLARPASASPAQPATHSQPALQST